VYIGYQYPGAYTNLTGTSIGYALSVRCLRDAETPTSSTLTPSDVQNMINNSLVPLQNQIIQQQNTIDSMQNVINQFQQQLNENEVCGFIKVEDYDGNKYNTVKIGNQCWMKENLRTTHYSDGTEIPLGTDSSSTIGYRYYPDNQNGTVPAYGYLYNWLAVMKGAATSNLNPSGVQGICPTGWHVPSNAEFTQLLDYVKSNNDNVCGSSANNISKSLAANSGWYDFNTNECAVGNNLSANNATGFSAYPAGHWSLNNSGYVGVFHWNWYKAAAEYWTCEQSATYLDKAHYMYLFHTAATVDRPQGSKVLALSVRCLKD
jgi:uncharacterized protein (TIGR02145 family)